MRAELQEALDKVDMTYQEINEIAEDILKHYTQDITNIIKFATDNLETLSNEDLRNLMLKLSLKSYSFSEIKEKSAIKSECAEMLKKEKYAKTFNNSDGSVAVRENTAILDTSLELVTEKIYDLVASLFKVRADEIHRVVDTLKTVLMSRLQELKLSQAMGSVGEEI